MQEGYDGLLRDKTRPSRIRPTGSNIIERVVALTQSDRQQRRPTGSPP